MMILPETYSQMGRSTAGHLNNLRRQLGVGCDPAHDYSEMNELRRTMKQNKNKKDVKEEKEDGGPLDELRLALERAQGPAAAQPSEDDEGEGGAEGSPQAGLTQTSKQAKVGKPSRAFLTPNRNHYAKQAAGNRFRAPPVGTYRPKMDLVDKRQHGADFGMRSPTRSKHVVSLEKQIADREAEGKSTDDLTKASISIDHLDSVPERVRLKTTDVDFSRQTSRPDPVKQAGIKYHDNSFTSGVQDGDLVTSKLLRTPSWDIAKMSTTEDKPRETFFQPGQYKAETGINLTRPGMQVKQLDFTKQTTRKPLVETVGLFEIKSRPGDHLPDRSQSRSCPCLSSQPRIKVSSFDKYSNRRPLVDPKKPYHRAEDPEIDFVVLTHSLTHDEMEASKVTWAKTRPVGKFDAHLSRDAHLRTQRSYGNDVCLRMSKENTSRGPVSVEHMDEVGNSPSLRPRVLTRSFEHMAPRDTAAGKYREFPSRGKDMDDALKFERGVRTGEGRAPAETLSPSASLIRGMRKARTYEADNSATAAAEA